jgi:hypothetical protein
MSKHPKYKRATKPISFESWALGIADKRQNPTKAGKAGYSKHRETVEETLERLRREEQATKGTKVIDG